uniref:RING-type E3 ubiquitin transferase n=1 Tax=Gallus gallus TaxID=9031 RepID=A0A8V0XXK7_CHICK
MAAEEAWTCPICRDVRQDVAYAIPCHHMFCLGCIHRWARLRASCPLCRTAMRTIRVPVRGDNQPTGPTTQKRRERQRGNKRE